MFECAMASAVGLLGSQLKIEILRKLVENASLSLDSLREMFPQAQKQALLDTLDSLKQENLVSRKKDEYAMSDFGRNLVPVLGLLDKWNQPDAQSDND